MTGLQWQTELSEDDAAQASELLRASEADPELPRGVVHLLAVRDRVVAYGNLDTAGDSLGNQLAEMTVHPEFRNQGIGGEMLQALADRAQPLRVWSHHNDPAAARLAEKYGFEPIRELHRMGMDFGADGFPVPRLPDGVRLRAFVPGQDEEAMVAVNARAFSWHLEQGSLTVQEVLEKEQRSWFDPAGFLLAVDADGKLLGFHWTKVHPDSTGEVYVVGGRPGCPGWRARQGAHPGRAAAPARTRPASGDPLR